MYGCQNPASTVHHIAKRLQIILTADLVHRDHLRCHRADQHHHSLRLGAGIQHICPAANIVLRDSLIAGGNLRTLIHHPDRLRPHFSTMLLPHLQHFSSFIFMSCTCLRPFKTPRQSRAPILSLFSIRHHPDQIPQKCCFSASRRRNQKRIPDTSRPWLRQNRPYFCCTSYHLMRKTDI